MDNRGKTLLSINDTVVKLKTDNGMRTSYYAISKGIKEGTVPSVKFGGKYWVIYEDLLDTFAMLSQNSVKSEQLPQTYGTLRKIM